MNPAIESLLEIVQKDPIPEEYSSYWKYHTRNFIARKEGDCLQLESDWMFGSFARLPLLAKLLHGVERFSYRGVTARWNSFPRVWKTTKELIRDLSGGLNFTVFKSACILSLLQDHWEEQKLSPHVFALIGDGYGFLGALIRRWKPQATLYHIDLPKMLVFQARTHELADRNVPIRLFSDPKQGVSGGIHLVQPGDAEKIPGQIDCAINIVSMQEMNMQSVRNYFTFLRRRSGPQSRFYCLNRVEKRLDEKEVLRFAEYPWSPRDKVFLDGVCPFYARYLGTWKSEQGPRLLGVRIPFVNYFDGVHLHRLANLAPEE